MGKLRMQEYACPDCGHRFDYLAELPDGAPSSMDSCPQTLTCEECDGDAKPCLSAPRIMNTALPDGTDRGDTWKQARELAHLKKARKGLRPEKRAELDSEMRKIDSRLARTAKPDRFQT